MNTNIEDDILIATPFDTDTIKAELKVETSFGSEVYDQRQPSEQALPFVRLMFHGGAKRADHNNTFENAAQNVNKDYENSAKIYRINTAQDIIKKINEQKDNSIQSIDFFTHGGKEALYFKNSGIFNLNNSLYINKKSDQGGWLGNSGSLDGINFSKFTNDAKIEMHGCNTASIDGENVDDENFAKYFSQKLFDAGKKNAVVIGHVVNANPNRDSSEKSDYRHGVRRIYHGGQILFRTQKEGRITANMINKYLELKEKQREKYDGSKQKE